VLLKSGQMLVAHGMRAACVIEDTLGEGAQAEVYRARIDSLQFALKWYRPEYAASDPRRWERLKQAINSGAPTEHYLWPFDLVSLPRSQAYGGYLMPLKPPEYVGFYELMRGKTEPTFRALTNAGFQLADSFLKLHAFGLCYYDINFGNIFFNPDTGDIRIADTDNVDVNGRMGGIQGTHGFMAPEVARNEALPNSATDRFSLAVLLFQLFMVGHPLYGKRQDELPYDPADPDATRRLCKDPVFIFDPNNSSNGPIVGFHDCVVRFWNIYPQSLRDLFIRAFTKGLHDPDARIMENEWRRELSHLQDSIFVCSTPRCETQNFFDLERPRRKQALNPCWACEQPLPYPPRMRVGAQHDSKLVVLSPGTQLFPHHLENDTYNFKAPLAEVVSNTVGLKNLSTHKWFCQRPDGSVIEVLPQTVLRFQSNCRIHFGKVNAEVKL
jgi:eukaryotic-like serine/threonine-protein kinase